MTNTNNSTPKNILTAFGHWNILGMRGTFRIAFWLSVLTVIMWFLNVSGLMGINLFLFFLGAIGIVVMATSLAAVMAAGVIGAFGAFFDDKDISQGTITGLSTLGKLIWGLLLGWFLIAGLLSTWSFAYNPAAFFFVAAGALTSMVALQFYKISTGKWLIIGVLTYCAIVVLLALGSTSPNMVKIGQTAKRTGDQFTNYVTSGDSTIPAQPVSPEEQDRREKVAKQDAAVAAAAILPPPLRMSVSDVRKDCGGNYAKLTNCRNVYFGQYQKYFVESAKGVCPVSDPSNAGTWESLGGNQYNFIPYSDNGVRVTFFEMKVGEIFGGYTCK